MELVLVVRAQRRLSVNRSSANEVPRTLLRHGQRECSRTRTVLSESRPQQCLRIRSITKLGCVPLAVQDEGTSILNALGDERVRGATVVICESGPPKPLSRS